MGKKTLFLLRHAKAITGNLNLPDQDRPLSEKGFRDAARLGEKIQKKGVHFDLILTSPAIRAITTAQLILNCLELKHSNILVDPRIYQATGHELLQLISHFTKKYDQILVIGHNPGLTDLASFLANEPVVMPTCSLVRSLYDFKDWHKILTDKPVKFSFVN